MIIEARNDILTLSGSLDKNLWPSIESAASLLLRLHPSGILIDASDLTNITSEGARTFLDAMAYIERYHARIVLCHVPDTALQVIRNVPGVRSQLPIAATCEQARASLELAAAARDRAGRQGRRADGPGGAQRNVLVPLLRGMTNAREAVALATQLGTIYSATDRSDTRGQSRVRPLITVSYILEVPRTMPLNAPFSEEEEAASNLLNEAQAALSELGAPQQTDVARTRDAEDEIIAQVARRQADLIVLALPPISESNDESFDQLVANLLTRAPCEVVLKR